MIPGGLVGGVEWENYNSMRVRALEKSHAVLFKSTTITIIALSGSETNTTARIHTDSSAVGTVYSSSRGCVREGPGKNARAGAPHSCFQTADFRHRTGHAHLREKMRRVDYVQ